MVVLYSGHVAGREDNDFGLSINNSAQSMITRHFPQPDLKNISCKYSLMDSFGGHTTNAVNIYEQSVGETPNLSAKSSFNNLSLNRTNVSKNSSH